MEPRAGTPSTNAGSPTQVSEYVARGEGGGGGSYIRGMGGGLARPIELRLIGLRPIGLAFGLAWFRV